MQFGYVCCHSGYRRCALLDVTHGALPNTTKSPSRVSSFSSARRHPKYLRGGASDLEEGLDCSGYVYLAAKWAGIPGICRTTSFRMSQGFGGWSGRDIKLSDADECDLLFWTFSKNQPFGHVGALLRGPHGCKQAAHASPRLGVVLRPLKGSLTQNLSKVRRLTIGE